MEAQQQPQHARPAEVFSPRAQRWIAYTCMSVLLLAVAYLAWRATGEGDRTNTAVTHAITSEQRRQADEQARQAAEQERQGRALCTGWKQAAESDVPANASEIARSLVRTAADAYALVHCDRFAGPLGHVDPEAYRPAPTPSAQSGN